MVSKPSGSFRLVFEVDGFPRELLTFSECKIAIASGELRSDTEVVLSRPGESPRATRVDHISELNSLFEPTVIQAPLAEVALGDESAFTTDEAEPAPDLAIATVPVVAPKNDVDRAYNWTSEDHGVSQDRNTDFVAEGYRPDAWPKLVFTIVIVIALALAWTWLGSFSEKKLAPVTVTYSARTTTNLRSAPTTVDSTIVGKLKPGERVTGLVLTSTDPPEWFKIMEGRHAGRFTWLKNLVTSSSNAKLPSISPSAVTVRPPETNMSALLSFSDAGACVFNPKAAELFDRMLKYDEATSTWRASGGFELDDQRTLSPVVTMKDIDPEYPGAKRYQSTYRFPPSSTWNGLRITGIRASQTEIPETDSTYSRAMMFSDGPAEVITALRTRGVSVPLEPAYRELPGDESSCGGTMELRTSSNGTELVCSWGC